MVLTEMIFFLIPILKFSCKVLILAVYIRCKKKKKISFSILGLFVCLLDTMYFLYIHSKCLQIYSIYKLLSTVTPASFFLQLFATTTTLNTKWTGLFQCNLIEFKSSRNRLCKC